MALKKGLAINAVRCTHNRAGTTLEVTDHPLADRFEIIGEIELCEWLAVAAIGPQRLVGIGDGDAHHLGALLRRGFRDNGFCDLDHGGLLGLYLARRLVLAQTLEGSLANVASLGPASEFDLGDEFWLQPMHVACVLRRILTAERAPVGRIRL